MSTLSSAFNSLATVSMVDFWQRYVRPDMADARASPDALVHDRLGVLIVFPALLYAGSQGSISRR
jgi:SSS family solute:Na+ symporter